MSSAKAGRGDVGECACVIMKVIDTVGRAVLSAGGSAAKSMLHAELDAHNYLAAMGGHQPQFSRFTYTPQGMARSTGGMPAGGVEPPRLWAADFKSAASTVPPGGRCFSHLCTNVRRAVSLP
jgi:hypothetical protein